MYYFVIWEFTVCYRKGHELSRLASRMLELWYEDNHYHPYATTGAAKHLAKAAAISVQQVRSHLTKLSE